MVFLHTCTEIRRTPELETTPSDDHPEALLISHAEMYVVPIVLPRDMDTPERASALRYRAHTSDTKEADFIHTELAE